MKAQKLETLSSDPKSTTDQAGFTLIEILVSIAIVAFGILGLIKVVDSIIYYQNESREISQATLLATNKIEEVKRISTNEPSGGKYGFNYLVTDYLTDNEMIRESDRTYKLPEVCDRPTVDKRSSNCRRLGLDKGTEGPKMDRTLTLRTYPPDSTRSFADPEQINLLEAVATTEWTDKKGKKKSVELSSLIHKRHFIE
jgi:prepilin-type N-terminal cleavage/methylation domain-containing protein|tara:strand:- start:243 stop:836 length:594 start_codon:yes stop_codon:yes gene_type:complete